MGDAASTFSATAVPRDHAGTGLIRNPEPGAAVPDRPPAPELVPAQWLQNPMQSSSHARTSTASAGKPIYLPNRILS